jgi:hypothetical protein
MRSGSVSKFLLLAPLCLAGCGSDDLLAPVRGRVLCNSKPVAAANVTFSPVPKSKKDIEPGKPGTGYTDSEGYFVLSTYKELDGALIGEHDVSVTLDDTNPAPCKRYATSRLEVKPGSNMFNVELNQ